MAGALLHRICMKLREDEFASNERRGDEVGWGVTILGLFLIGYLITKNTDRVTRKNLRFLGLLTIAILAMGLIMLVAAVSH